MGGPGGGGVRKSYNVKIPFDVIFNVKVSRNSRLVGLFVKIGQMGRLLQSFPNLCFKNRFYLFILNLAALMPVQLSHFTCWQLSEGKHIS